MTVAELIEELKKYPSDMLVLRTCGGDCSGSTPLTPPMLVRAWPSNEEVYHGEYNTEIHPRGRYPTPPDSQRRYRCSRVLRSKVNE